MIPTSIHASPFAPATTQSCRVTQAATQQSPTASVVVGNRTKHSHVTASLVFIAYDSENTRVSQAIVSLRLEQTIASALSSQGSA